MTGDTLGERPPWTNYLAHARDELSTYALCRRSSVPDKKDEWYLFMIGRQNPFDFTKLRMAKCGAPCRTYVAHDLEAIARNYHRFYFKVRPTDIVHESDFADVDVSVMDVLSDVFITALTRKAGHILCNSSGMASLRKSGSRTLHLEQTQYLPSLAFCSRMMWWSLACLAKRRARGGSLSS